jgi:hypothetical protein
MAVPDTNTFTLQNVVDEVNPTTNDLADCFADANPLYFDPTYEGSKNSLLNFRNYGSVLIGEFGLAEGSISHGYVWNEDEVWSDTRDATFGVAAVTSGDYKVGVGYGGGSFIIYRNFWTFNLASLSGKTIVSAKLEFAITSQTGIDVGGVIARIGSQAKYLGVGDFDAFSSTEYAFTRYIKINASGACRAYIRLEAANLAELNAIEGAFGGSLKLAILHDYDEEDIQPSSELSYTFYRAGECVTGCICQPRLTISYK